MQLVDPPAYSLPYDASLGAALVRAGAEVELATSRPAHGTAPALDGVVAREVFYPWATARGRTLGLRRALRLAEHVPGMLRHRRAAAGFDIVHYQWLTLEALDAGLLASGPVRVFTSHNVLRRGGGVREHTVRRLFAKMDAVIAHTAAGGEELVHRFGAAPGRVRVIPHGAFDYLTRLPREDPLPAELVDAEGPVVLFFGLLRDYKGLEVLLESFAGIEGAELWVVGRPMMDTAALRAAASRAGGRVRLVERFVAEAEVPALFRRADVVVLPYRQIDQSGVLYTALAFGKALVLSDVGGFSEVGREHGAARLVAPGDPAALHDALSALLADPDARASLERAAAAAAAGPYSWDDIGRRTLALYEELTT